MIDDVRQATNSNYALGTKRFRQEIEQAFGRCVGPGKAGRPKREGAVKC